MSSDVRVVSPLVFAAIGAADEPMPSCSVCLFEHGTQTPSHESARQVTTAAWWPMVRRAQGRAPQGILGGALLDEEG